jgi:hypothetical protein
VLPQDRPRQMIAGPIGSWQVSTACYNKPIREAPLGEVLNEVVTTSAVEVGGWEALRCIKILHRYLHPRVQTRHQ